MTQIPGLTFIYGAAASFLSAKCGLNRKEKPIKVKQIATSSDGIKCFAAQFDFRLTQKHLAEYWTHGQHHSNRWLRTRFLEFPQTTSVLTARRFTAPLIPFSFAVPVLDKLLTPK
jgi:hypothetical protein